MTKIILWIFFIISFFFLAKAVFLPTLPDFATYYHASQAYFSGKNPYTVSSTFSSFVYPPVALFLFLPFGLLPLPISQILWNSISLISFITAVFLLLRIENEPLFSSRFLLLFSLSLLSFPAKFTLGMGQINLVIFLFLTLFLYFYKEKKAVLSANFLGLALSIKLFPLLSPILFLFRKQWKLFFLLCGTILALLVLSLSVFSWQVLLHYWVSILPKLSTSIRTDYYNQALSGFGYRMFGQSTNASTLIRVLTGIILLISLYTMWNARRKHTPLLFGFLITTQLICNSFSEQHYFIWLIIPYIQIIYILLNKKARFLHYFPIALSFFLTQSNLKYPASFPIPFQSHVLYGTILLCGYMLYILIRHENSLFN